MDISGLNKARTSSLKKRIAYLIGAALAGAAMAVLGAMPKSVQPDAPASYAEPRISVETRIQRLEQSDARTQEAIQSIKEDTHYTRDRLDHFIDSQKGNH